MDALDLLTQLLADERVQAMLSDEVRARVFDVIVGLSAASVLLRKVGDWLLAKAKRTSSPADDKLALGVLALAGALEAVHRVIRPVTFRGRGRP